MRPPWICTASAIERMPSETTTYRVVPLRELTPSPPCVTPTCGPEADALAEKASARIATVAATTLRIRLIHTAARKGSVSGRDLAGKPQRRALVEPSPF